MEIIPSIPINPIDTTGAGDAFVGSLAYFLAYQRPLRDAIERACGIATQSVLKAGTQTSFPHRDEVMGLLAW